MLKSIAVLVSLGVAGALLSGCGGASASDPAAPAAAAAGYPVNVDNCGMKETFNKAPRRVVSIKSTATELLLALGLGDKIVGRAFADGPIPAQWEKAAADIPTLSDKAPSQEVVLAKEPDLVYAGWESNLEPETAGDRDTLAKLGVKTYVSPAACKEPKYQPKKMTFDLLFQQFTEVGRIFGVAKKADELIREEKQKLRTVKKAKPATTALWWSSATDIPYVGAGIGAPQMVLDAVGLDNIVGGVKDTWTSMSWEKIADENPDVIVLVDATWNSAEHKIEYLESNAVTSRLDAVKHHRYLTIPFPASEAGVRTAAAAVDLGNQLSELGNAK